MNPIEKYLNTLKDIRLSDETRTRIRAELLSYAELHTTPAGARATRSPFTLFRLRMYAGLSAAVLLIAALGGTALASENALPGDALYSVKVGITEPIQTALVPSDRGKAAWHAILAERRLDETAKLAASGKLSTSTQDVIAQNFTAQVSASQEGADKLQEKGDTDGSLSVRSDLEARLAAHAQILAIIDAHFATASSSDAVDTHEALTHMLALVEDHEKAVTAARLALEDAIAPEAAKNDSAVEATGTPALTIADASPAEHHKEHANKVKIEMPETPTAQVETAKTVRTMEVKDILERHAALLAKFLPAASTTSTSTATTTDEATSTETGILQHSGLDTTQLDGTTSADSDAQDQGNVN